MKLTQQQNHYWNNVLDRMIEAGEPEENIKAAYEDFGKNPLSWMSGTEPEITSEDTFLQGHPILKFFSSLAGTQGLARGISQGLFLKSKEGQQTLKDIQKGKSTYQDLLNVTGQPVTNKQILGSTATAGLNIGLAGQLPIPEVKATTALGRIGLAAAKGAGIGAAGGGIQAFSEDKDTGTILKTALKYGLITGAITGGIQAGVEGIKALRIPERLANAAIKPELPELKKDIRFNGQTLGKKLVDRGLVGTDRSLFQGAIENIETNEDKLQRILDKSNQTISREELKPFVDEVIKAKLETPGLAEEVPKIQKVLDELPKNFTVSEANVYKRNIYSALKDTAFRIDPSLSTKKEAMKAVASGLKQLIESKAGSNAVRGLNEELAFNIELRDRMIDKLAKTMRTDILSNFVMGNFKKLTSPTVIETGLATGLSKASQVASNLTSKPVARVGLFNLLRGIESQSNK